MAAERRWNLNEAEGRFAQTNIREPVIEVELGLNQTNGPTVPVGRFRLNLVVMAAKGVVTKRGKVYDVQIYRESDGSYTLGVRRSQTTPLEPFRVR